MKSGAKILVATLGLLVAAGATTAAFGQDGFRWPVSGRVISDFIATKGTGVNIAAPEGTNARAAEDGQVIYVGSGVEGYGNLVLIRHPNGYVTAYAHLDCAVVAKGDTVTLGQLVGAVGMSGSVSSPQLHFETRKGATPVDPVALLNGTLEEPVGVTIVTDRAVIMEIQQLLTDLGYAPGKIDGKVGAATRAAIREFEQVRGYEVRGEPTAELVEQLKADPTVASEPPPRSVSEPAAPLEVVSVGGPEVESVCKTAEVAIALPAPEPLTVEPAPVEPAPVGTAPEEPSGIAALLLGLLTPPPSADGPIGNEDVFEVQRKLTALGLYEGKVDGLYGPDVARSIRAFEELVKITPTGELRPQIVWLIKEYNGAPVADAGTEQTLILSVQRGLQSLGFLHGEIDGVAGEATTKAIRNFEVYYNYDVTGRITPELINLLVQNGAAL